MRKRRLNSGYSGNVDNRRNVKGCMPASKHYMERVLGRLDSLNYFLLDSFPGVSVAYSLRSLDGNFENPVVQVRRSSDNAESNFTAQEVSDGTLEAWCGGGDGYVSIWYDQSGNGKNAVQGTAASQPQIVSMGVLNKENGNPCLTFDGVNDHLQAASVTLPAHVSCMVVARSTRTGTNPKLWFEHSPDVNPSNGMYFNGTYWAVWAVRRSGSIHYGPSIDNTDWIGEDQAIASLLYNGHGYIYKNSQFVTNATTSGTSTPNTNVTDTLNIGSRNGSSAFLTSNMQEMLVYPAMTPERMRLVETDMNLHYNVYDASTLLGQYSGAAAAYSLRKVSYTNDDVYVVRVRRSTTNEERDFLSSEITDGTLETWCDSGDGFVSVWYDQSGNNRDAAQATAANQPKIVSSGVLVLENGLPAIEFDGSNDYLANTTHNWAVQPTDDLFAACLASPQSTGMTIAASRDYAGTFSYKGWQWRLDASTNYMRVLNFNGSVADASLSNFAPTLNDQFLLVARLASNGDHGVFANGSDVETSNDDSLTAYTPATDDLLIGAVGIIGLTIADYFDGTIQELIIYPTNQSTNRIAIEDNINEYYDIFDRTVLLLHMDGPDNSTFFYDSSRNGHPITVNGNTKISTTQSKFGGSSAFFDGDGDYIECASSSGFAFGTGEFTVECWVNFSSLPTTNNYAGFFGTYTTIASASNDAWFFSVFNLSGSLKLWLQRHGDGNIYAYSDWSPSLNTWYHVAAVRDSNQTIHLFVNGIKQSVTSSNNWGSGNFTRSGPFGVGLIANPSYFNGYIDELKIVKGKALYTGNFTPPQAPFNDDNYTSLLLHMDGTNGSTSFVDSSSNAHTITANGNAQISSAQSKFGGTSAAFDGTGDYLTLGGEAAFAFGTGDFTIEMWVYFNNVSGDGFLYDSRGPNGLYPSIYRNGSVIRYYTDSASRIASGTVAANQWYHVAVVRSGGTTTLFLNGSQQGTYADTNDYLNDALRPIIGAVGQSGFVGVSSLNGYIDDLRITKGLARYTGNFIPPTAPHPDPVPEDPYFGYVSLLLPMDDGFVDKSFRRHIVTANGDAAISTTQSKFGGASAAFDGTGDYLTVANDASLQLTNSAAWTLEFWFYANALAAQQHLLHRYLVTSPFNGFGFAFGSGGAATTTLRFWDGSTWRDIETSVATGQWRHVAVSYEGSGTTARMFLDGSQKGAAFTPSASIANTANNLGIGAQYDGSLPFNGYIDDLRITKGVARYTANFTPPTSPHPIP